MKWWKIKTVNDKIDQNKDQYNLDRQTGKISGLSSGNVGKYEFLIGDVLPKKGLLEKAALIKRFEYFALGNEFKKQNDITKTISWVKQGS